MESLLTPEVIGPLLTQLGFAVVFMYYFERERNERRKTIEEKDKKLEELNTRVLSSFEKNTEVTQAFKGSIEANTKATDSLAENVDYFLRSGNDHK